MKDLKKALSLLAVLCILFAFTACDSSDYEKAVSAMEAGNYEEAIAAFEALAGYKDSDALAESCRAALKDAAYNEALALYENGAYEEALAAFEAMEGYRDSSALMDSCRKDAAYTKALSLLETGEYEEALAAFNSLAGYKDSNAQIMRILSSDGYRRQAPIGSNIYFGAYEQDNDASNGKEPIEWRVLARENDRVLVISEYGLDRQLYNSNLIDTTWAQCTLRAWLNDSFLNEAFSAEEQALIAATHVTADLNPKHNTNPGSGIDDKVFLLSIVEAEKYFSDDASRCCAPTPYAVAQGANCLSSYKTLRGEDSCAFWLRTPGHRQDYNTYVIIGGAIAYDGTSVIAGAFTIRPALWINTGV